MNELLLQPPLCWYATRGTGELRRGNQLILLKLLNNTSKWISLIFRDRAKAALIYFPISAAMFLMVFQRLMWTKFFYFTLTIRLYHEFLSQLICHFDTAFFRTLLTLDTYRFQTHKQNISKFYLIILYYLIIQITKLQIEILNLNTTFRDCKKIWLLLKKGVLWWWWFRFMIIWLVLNIAADFWWPVQRWCVNPNWTNANSNLLLLSYTVDVVFTLSYFIFWWGHFDDDETWQWAGRQGRHFPGTV